MERDVDIPAAVNRLVDEYRSRCLWFLRPDFYPTTDPGFSPASILEHAGRTTHYSTAEVTQLAFAGATPAEHAGKCVLTDIGDLCKDAPAALRERIAKGTVRFHEGCIRGALPEIR